MPSEGSKEKYIWYDVPRRDAPQRPADQRVGDFQETHAGFDAQTAQAQASRCIQCAMPFCTAGCPFYSRIPEWLGLVAEGRFVEAATLAQSTGSLPEICAHLCVTERTCEGMCTLRERGDAIPIAAIEEFIHNEALHHTPLPHPMQANGREVAVVGAGPAGLACADVLATHGYGVTVFEAAPRVGGTLASRIPSFKLEEPVLHRRVELLQQKGVSFRTEIQVGRDVPFDSLLSDFDAVFLAAGAQTPIPLTIPGHDLKGVYQAALFLSEKRVGPEPGLEPAPVEGRAVVVLGGGDTALDCARTAIRCRARSVTCLYRRDQADMRASKADLQSAIEEGVQFLFLGNPIRLDGDPAGRVSAVVYERTAPGEPEADGRRRPVRAPEPVTSLAAEVVIVAFGFRPNPLALGKEAFELNDHGGVWVDERQMTSIPRVFAGGSVVHGPDLVVKAVHDGYRAALNIEQYLSR